MNTSSVMAGDVEDLLSRLSNSGTREAADAAEELGRLESVPALTVLIGREDTDLLNRYIHGFRRGVSNVANQQSVLPQDIERVIVRYYHDRKVGGAMHTLASSRNYTSRALFDLRFAELASHAHENRTQYIAELLKTDQPVPGEVLDLLPRMHERMQYDLLYKLGSRGYDPAGEQIARFLLDEQGKPKHAMRSLYQALVRIGTAQSLDLLVTHLGKFPRVDASEEDRKEVTDLLSAIAHSKNLVPVDPAQLGRNTPYLETDNKVLRAYMQVISVYGFKSLAQGLYGHLSNQELQRGVFDTLMTFDDIGIWSRTRSEIDRLNRDGRIEPHLYEYMITHLKQRLDNPEKYEAEKLDAELNQAMHREKSQYEVKHGDLRRARDSLDAQSFMSQYDELLKSMEQLAVHYAAASHVRQINSQLVNGYLELGSYARFKAGQPRQAIRYYDAAHKFMENSENNLTPVIYLLLADTWRFDLGDTGQAIGYYRLALDEARVINKHPPRDLAGTYQFIARWMAHELDYLVDDKKYSGRLGRVEIGECAQGGTFLTAAVESSEQAMAAMLGYGYPDPVMTDGVPGNGAALNLIESIPRSQVLLSRVFQYLPFLKADAQVDAILQERDPARYLTACLLGQRLHRYSLLKERFDEIADAADSQQDVAREVVVESLAGGIELAERLRKDENIVIDFGADAQLANPEQTWERFIAALRSGDRDRIKSCFTLGMQEKWRDLLVNLTGEQFAELAEGLSGLQGGAIVDEETRFYYSSRQGRGGEIWFSKIGGEWLIGEM
jgi:tetratricopeptide (TPR) repeat protein